MRICILSNPRTGSSSLYGLIHRHLPKHYYSVSEPFNQKYMESVFDNREHINVIESSNDVFIKNIVYQYPKKYNNKEQWYDWLFLNFDKIILLDRKDRVAQSESFVYHETKNNINWHIKSYYDLSDVNPSKINERIFELENDGRLLLDKSNEFPMFYYEDLFVEKNIEKINELFLYLNITPIQKYVDLFVLSDFKKVRKFKKNTSLL
jgi:hypothetical protein